MVMIAGIAVLGIGLAMVVIGVVMNVFDYKKQPRQHPGVTTKKTGLAKTINALTRFLAELGKHSPGTQMIAWGFLLIVVGGALAGASYL